MKDLSVAKSNELPLFGKRIVVTRAEEQSENVVLLLRKAGASVIMAPTIKIVPAELSSEDERRTFSFYEYDVVIFPSMNSVRNFFVKIENSRQPSSISHQPLYCCNR